MDMSQISSLIQIESNSVLCYRLIKLIITVSHEQMQYFDKGVETISLSRKIKSRLEGKKKKGQCSSHLTANKYLTRKA